MRTRILAIVLGLLATWWPATPAAAAWSSGSAGTGVAASAAAPLPPTAFTATCPLLFSAKIDLHWSASATPWVSGYEIGYRAGAAGPPYTWGPIVTGTSYTTASLGGGSHHFAVRSVKGSWRSAATANASRTITVIVVPVACG